MRDYTTNNYCDFLWISDLLELKRDGKNGYLFEVRNGQKVTKCNIVNVIIFGTIIEVKETSYKGVLYQVDDGTGVIACKRSEEQFEQIMSVIEQEQADILNESREVQLSLEQSSITDTSADDSIFNDRSVQMEEVNFNKKSRLRGLQSIWDDIYKSFNSLIEPYNIGDSVIIHGKLYTYFNINQIYINNIRAMDIGEEIMLITLKLEDGFERGEEEAVSSKPKSSGEKRLSGLVTFDNIPHPHPKLSVPAIEMPEWKEDMLNSPGIVTPNLDPIITFDTFTSLWKIFGTGRRSREIRNMKYHLSDRLEIRNHVKYHLNEFWQKRSEV